MRKKVFLLLTDLWNDWEASYTTAVLNSDSNYTVHTISTDLENKESMGGLKVGIDYCLDDFQLFDEVSVLLIPGGLSWENCDDQRIISFIQKCIDSDILVATSCGSSAFMGKCGFLNNIYHTADSLEAVAGIGEYTGEDKYLDKQLVFDKGIITSNETASVQFAYEIFKYLKIDSDDEIEIWFNNFSKGATSI